MASKNFSQILKDLRLRAGYTQKEVYEHFKIPQSTFSSWEVGKSEPSGEMLIKLCEFYKCDMMKEFSSIEKTMYTSSEITLIENYRKLDYHGKDIVDTILLKELDRIKESQNAAEENKASDIIYINFAQGSASAGNGNTLFGDLDDEPLAVIANNITEKADFVVKVKGNSMLPEYSDGDIVLVSKQPVDTGDIGLFVINGDGYIKKKGNHELISINPEYKNIPVKEFDAVYCMGKVIDKLDLNWIAK